MEREFQLGADTVSAGNQYRLAVFFRDFEQRAKAANAGQHLGPHGALGIRLDRLDQGVAGVDVHAGIAV